MTAESNSVGPPSIASAGTLASGLWARRSVDSSHTSTGTSSLVSSSPVSMATMRTLRT